MDDFWAVQLTARKIEEETGLSVADQAAMPLDEWSRLAYGQTPMQAALQALEAQREPPAQHGQPTSPEPAPAPGQQPQGVDVASMDWPTYAEYRRETGIGQGRKEQKGIFDAAPSRSETYADAVRAQAGRTALSVGNTTEAPRLNGRHVHQGDMRDTRSAAQRFSTPGNSFTL